jgi:serine/threonine protein kinase
MSVPNPAPDPRERELFVQALEQATERERAAFLAGACGNDLELRGRVEALLARSEGLGGFLEQPVVSPAAAGVNHPAGAPCAFTEKAGDRIGRYKLLEKIGEGGCGVVYVAQQEEPVRRRVALKVIKLGMDTRSVVARFEAERQALALMDHPNIAKVLDAAATETGRPYFVMELVRGVKITDYCDQKSLPTSQRLELFIQVCRAVQHAHQKGIIHRDLKPSNILVTVNDGAAVPKVIDFGIAKATQRELTDKTVYTQFQQFIGTPAYMSPEQAEMTSIDIDTRADIYGLGVLLYELLTGKTPFDSKELLGAGLDAMRRTIREKEPARPSTRLSTMVAADLTAIARRRQTEPPKLLNVVRGDLDWIVMKCLEKDRTRRYETANGLGEDVTRHLRDQPVLVRPPGMLYRFRKLVRRNKLMFAAGAAVAIALVVGLGFSTWMFLQEQATRKRAVGAEKVLNQLRRQDQTQAIKTKEVAHFIKDLLDAIGPSVAQRLDTNQAKELLGNAKEILDKTSEHAGEGTHQ